MRALLLTVVLAIPASAASLPATPAPLFSAPAAPVLIIPVPGTEKFAINPNPRAALGLCPPTAAQLAADRARESDGRAAFHKLTDLPPGNMYVAVPHHDVNGCEVPIVVKYGLGR